MHSMVPRGCRQRRSLGAIEPGQPPATPWTRAGMADSCQTVPPATTRKTNCATGDSWPGKLCSWRQRARQTVSQTTASATNCASGDNETDKLCPWRQLAGQTVPPTTTRGGFGALAVAGCTVCSRGCRQMHSMTARVSSDVQYDRAAVAGGTVLDLGGPDMPPDFMIHA